MKKLTPDMQRVISRLKAHDVLYYSTQMDVIGPWFGTDHSRVRNTTVDALERRGLVRRVYAFPTGTVVLT